MSKVSAHYMVGRALSSVGRASRLHRANSHEMHGNRTIQNGTERDSMANEAAVADHLRTTHSSEEVEEALERAMTVAGLITSPAPETVQHVYFVQAGASGPIKIGVATDVKARVAAHQVSHYETLILLATTPGGIQLEREYHKRFRAHRIRGEWFHPDSEICLEIDRLKEAGGDFLLSSMDEWELEFWAKSPDPEQAAPYIQALERQRKSREANGRAVAKLEFARRLSTHPVTNVGSV